MIAVQLVEVMICLFMIVFCEGNSTMEANYPITKHSLTGAYTILIFWNLFSVGVFEMLSESRREDREDREYRDSLRGVRSWRRLSAKANTEARVAFLVAIVLAILLSITAMLWWFGNASRTSGLIIKNEGVALPDEQYLDFIGSVVNCVNNPGALSNDCTFTGGGGGTPGGSNTQLQYNNAGAFGGITGATTNGVFVTLVAPVLGTPASVTLTNATGLPLTTGVVGILPPANGGTGIANNNASTITIAGSFATTLTITGTTGVTLPISGTLATLAGAETFTNKVSYNGLVITSNTGAITTGSWAATVIPLAFGGTSASLVASNGGIFYSTGSAGAILSGTATAGQILRSGASAAPSWSTATYPTLAGTINNVLTSDGTNWISAAPSAASSIRWDQVVAPNTTAGFITPAGDETTLIFQATTQTAWTMSSATLTTGKLMNIVSTSTALPTGTDTLNTITVSGANAASSVIARGFSISVTNTGTTGTNKALVLQATGATTNIALEFIPGSGFSYGFNAAGGYLQVFTNNAGTITNTIDIGPNNILMTSNGYWAWSNSTTDPTMTIDTQFSRASAGILSLDTGTTGNGLGSLEAATVSLGVNGTTTGLLNLLGTTSGTVGITTAAAAGTWTLTLPTTGGTNGFVLTTNGSGVTSWAAASATSRWDQILAPNTTAGFTSPAGDETTLTFSATTQTGWTMQSSTLTQGMILSVKRTSTALPGGNYRTMEILSSGANGTASVTAEGLVISVTNTGTLSANTALRLAATGAASTNTALIVEGGRVNINSDLIFYLGSGVNSAFVHNSGGLAANTALTGVLLGTPVTPAVFANTTIISNTNTFGEMLFTVNASSGNSKAMIYLDNSGHTHLYDSGVAAITTASGGLTLAGNVTFGGLVTSYNGKAAAGMGVAPIYGSAKQTAVSTAATVLTVTPPAATGTYRLTFAMDVSAATAATLGWTATWTDSGGNAEAPANLGVSKSGAIPALTVIAAAGDTYYGEAIISVNNSATNIVIKTTFAGTSYAGLASATVERLN